MKLNRAILSGLFLAFALCGCEQLNERLGLEDPAKRIARQDVEGRAIEGGCRQSGRAIEDCYAIYAGWREMDEYMRENSLETIVPVLSSIQDPSRKKKGRAQPAEPASEETPEPRKFSETDGAITPGAVSAINPVMLGIRPLAASPPS